MQKQKMNASHLLVLGMLLHSTQENATKIVQISIQCLDTLSLKYKDWSLSPTHNNYAKALKINTVYSWVYSSL